MVARNMLRTRKGNGYETKIFEIDGCCLCKQMNRSYCFFHSTLAQHILSYHLSTMNVSLGLMKAAGLAFLHRGEKKFVPLVTRAATRSIHFTA